MRQIPVVAGALATLEDHYGTRASLFATELQVVKRDGQRNSIPLRAIGSVYLRREAPSVVFVIAGMLPTSVMYLLLSIAPAWRGGSCSFSLLEVLMLAWTFIALPTCALLFWLRRRWTLDVVAAAGHYLLYPHDLPAARHFRDRLAQVGELPVQ